MQFLKSVNILFSKPFDASTQDGRAKERTRRIALTAVSAAISKVLSTIIPFITIRLTLEYLGVELYGLWNAVTSFFALFVFADLGLGNGLQTQLSCAYGHEDILLQRKIVFNSYAILITVSLVLITIFEIIYPLVDWCNIMNAKSEFAESMVGPVVLAIVLCRLIMIPLSLIQRVQLAYQEGYNSNWWQCVASIISLISIYIVYHYRLGQLSLIWVSSMIPLVIFILNSTTYYRRKQEKFFNLKLFDKRIIKTLLKTGFSFFFLSILTTIGLAIDTFIVARVGDLEQATPFSIMHKLACFISIIVGMLCTPLWSANGEALARGDKKWVKSNTKKMIRISFVFSLAVSILLVAFSNFIFKIWLGPEFKFSVLCLSGMCLTQILLSVISPYFMVLNAAGIVKKQIVVFSIFTVVSVVLKVWLGSFISVNIIPWITDICYVALVYPFIIKWSNKVLH